MDATRHKARRNVERSGAREIKKAQNTHTHTHTHTHKGTEMSSIFEAKIKDALLWTAVAGMASPLAAEWAGTFWPKKKNNSNNSNDDAMRWR